MRIVSLLPSTTEIVARLGQLPNLVGVSHECDEPSEVRDLPRLTSTPLSELESSAEIDEAVKSRLQQGLTLYELDVERLIALEPDVILTQDACEVCALDLESVESALADALPDAKLVSVQPKTLAEVYAQFVTIGDALGVPERGRAEADAMASEMAAWASRVPGMEDVERPSVYCIEWLDPPMVAGHWVPELIELAGGRYPWLDPGDRSPYVTWEEIAEADPDRIVVSPCGFDMIATYDALSEVEGRAEWQQLRAVREDNVIIVDGNAYMNRSGPRLVDTLGLLVQHLWPDVDSPRDNDRRARQMLELETKSSSP